MVFLPNLGVNRRSRLCDVASYVSAQELDFLELEQKSSSVNWKHQKVTMPILPIYGWALPNSIKLQSQFEILNVGLGVKPPQFPHQKITMPCQLV